MADPLALAVTQLPGWRWRAGMLGLGDGADGWRARVVTVDDRGIPDLWASYLWRRESDGSEWAAESAIVRAWGTPGWAAATWRGALPDLDDEATGGVLLGMLHATGRLRSLDVRPPGLPDEVEMAPWCVWLDLDDPEGGWIPFDAPTLARACAAALVAIWRCA